jgi:acetyltransferase-like isoleucine patch superfamily enzyme
VTRSCEPHTLLAGNPAKVIKSGISWQRERIGKRNLT